MSVTSGLLRTHAELTRRSMQLQLLIAQPTPPPEAVLAAERRPFLDLLKAHVQEERRIVYPVLLDSDDAQTAALARQFLDELELLVGLSLTHMEAWPDEQTAIADWSGYAAASLALLDRLSIRGMRVKRLLYPLAEQGHPASE